MKIAVLGDGAWGTALACNLLSNGHEVVMWGAFPDYLEEMARKRENFKFLPGAALPESLRFSPDPAEAAEGAELLLLATPTQFLRSVLKKFAKPKRRKTTMTVDTSQRKKKFTAFRADFF